MSCNFPCSRSPRYYDNEISPKKSEDSLQLQKEALLLSIEMVPSKSKNNKLEPVVERVVRDLKDFPLESLGDDELDEVKSRLQTLARENEKIRDYLIDKINNYLNSGPPVRAKILSHFRTSVIFT